MRQLAISIAIYDGKYSSDMSALALSCTLEGTVEGVAPAALFRGVATLLEMCEKRYSTPAPTGDSLTVFIGRKAHGGLKPLVRIDVLLKDGFAHASILDDDMPRTDAEPRAVFDDDDVLIIVRKVLVGR